MGNMLKEMLQDALCTGKQLGFILLLAIGIALSINVPLWCLVWLLGGIK